MTSKMDEALSASVKEEIREALARIKRTTPGFRDRPSQRKLIAEAARALSGFYGERRILVAEAPTGTGKSIGYMLGAIPVAKSLDKRIIISTGTVALQEQLVNRDIPTLQERSGLEFTFMLAKGRGRYACNRNLAELSGSDARQETLDLNDDVDVAAWPFNPSNEQRDLVHDMERALKSGTWSGDLDEWDGQIDDDMKGLLVTSHGGCLGRSCPHFYQCGFHTARSDMKKADVIVANHDLVMSDMKLGGGAILPAQEDSIYLFDEAHHLPDVALAHGSAETNMRAAIDSIGKMRKAFGEALGALKGNSNKAKEAADNFRDLSEELKTSLKEASRYLDENFPDLKENKFRRHNEPEVWRFQSGKIPEGFETLSQNIAVPASNLTSMMSTILDAAREGLKKGTIDAPIANRVGKNLSFHRDRMDMLTKTWEMMLEKDYPGQPPMARWVSRMPGYKRKAPGDLIVSCSPTSAAWKLRSQIWDKASGVILASATLSAMGRFDHFAERAGLSLRDGTQFLRLPSPFNYPENGELVIPNMWSDPSRPDDHTEEVISLLNEQINLTAGNLVLFSARKQMLDVADKVIPEIKGKLLIQGELSKSEILERHRDAIEAGKGSVIFGLASFSEGVDLPGKLCEHVFIAKLPFAVPDSPVDATYSEWLQSVGRNPFMEISVPDACTKLVQACGRLIRTETDRGRIVLLDRRVVTKRYGNQMLNSLPPFRRVIEPVQQSA